MEILDTLSKHTLYCATLEKNNISFKRFNLSMKSNFIFPIQSSDSGLGETRLVILQTDFLGTASLKIDEIVCQKLLLMLDSLTKKDLPILMKKHGDALFLHVSEKEELFSAFTRSRSRRRKNTAKSSF